MLGEEAENNTEQSEKPYSVGKSLLVLTAWFLLTVWSIVDDCNHGPAKRQYESYPQALKDKMRSLIAQERHDSLMQHNEQYRIAYEQEQQLEQTRWEEAERNKLGRSFEVVMANMPGISINPWDCRKLKGGALEYERGGQKISFVGDLENLSIVEYHTNIRDGLYPAHAQFLENVSINILGRKGAAMAVSALRQFLKSDTSEQVIAVAERHVTFKISRTTGDLMIMFVR
jgi:hypothetical protein